MAVDDPRRAIPRTDALLADPELRAAATAADAGEIELGRAVRATLTRARAGELSAEQVRPAILAALGAGPRGLRPVLNATGVVIHTNLGRAPLADGVLAAMTAAGGYVDVELDLATGARAGRGRGALNALLAAVPAAQAALVVNNGAAALVLATTALAAGRAVVMSRGEMVEIGDGFRLHELIASTGAHVVEVGTTNRTTLADYAAVDPVGVGCLLKVHPSNFVVEGFVSAASIAELATLPSPLVVDIGSGLLAPDPSLPDEPDAATALSQGAGLVLCSGDKLLGGPQAGLLLGRADLIGRLRRHPLYRALRADKVTLAGVQAAVRQTDTSLVAHYRRRTADEVRALAERLLAALPGVEARLVVTSGRVGGGSAPGVPLPGWGIGLPERYAERLRLGEPAVLARLDDGMTVLDLRAVPADAIDELATAVRAAAQGD